MNEAALRYKIYLFIVFGIAGVLLWQVVNLVKAVGNIVGVEDVTPQKTIAVNLFERLAILSPRSSDVLDNTFTLSGYGQGFFEGLVSVEVLDDNDVTLYSGAITIPDNYTKPTAFRSPITLRRTATSEHGRVVFREYSAKDGSISYLTTRSVTFKNHQ